jgi:hypothetical protein
LYRYGEESERVLSDVKVRLQLNSGEGCAS